MAFKQLLHVLQEFHLPLKIGLVLYNEENEDFAVHKVVFAS